MGQEWCSDDVWGQDVIECCPSTCTAAAGGVRRKKGNGNKGGQPGGEQGFAGGDALSITGGGALFQVWKVNRV